MADPLSIAASVVAVATLAYKSCQALNDTISSLKNVPKIIQDLRNDLNTLQSQLHTLKAGLDDIRQQGGQGLAAGQQERLRELEPALKACQECCEEFTRKLLDKTSHSGANHVDWRDRWRLHFNDNEFSLLKSRLSNYKQTLEIALSIMTIKQVSQNGDALQGLETQIATAVSDFSGQIKGIEMAVQTMSLQAANISQSDVDNVVAVLNDHDRVLKQCLKVCTSALTETTAVTGTQVKYARTFEEARQFVGNIGDVVVGGPPTKVEHGEARGKSRQVIGNMDGDFAREFLC
ncbi:hypothetical protein NM208_g7437 [Fusarium decemcellulare]|uniref:Uncharacterized protein n=1 Tax=Fusarium decemcellulare TaxID=57161 RepID=A0ACC1S955_9HYPO|nr:hypothetical protein NM208_g7437 [Fusarium decemcellulare]